MYKKSHKIVRGFTLIELLAVIVILGIIMLVAIPAVTGYISGARNDSYVNDAALFIDGIKNIAITKNRLPFADGQVYLFKVSGEGGLSLESGGKQSPYGVNWDEQYTYVAIANINGNYEYAFAGNDEQGNFIPLSTLEYINNNIEVENAGSKAESRKCIAGIAVTEAVNINKCKSDAGSYNTGQWEEDNLGNTVNLGFEVLKPTGAAVSAENNFGIFINGIMSNIQENGSYKRRLLYVVRVFTRADDYSDLGYKS